MEVANVYVLNIYYIGFSSRYDGTGNTDTVTTRLFKNQNSAIDAAIEYIQDHIDETIGDGVDVDRDPKFEDQDKLKRILKAGGNYNIYNFEGVYMLTLEHTEVED